MVRLGDIVPVELLSKESLDQPSPIEPYNWEEYSLHQRDIREGVVDREPPMEEMADEVKLSELLHLVYDILYLFVRNLNYNFLVGDPILSMSIAFPILIFLVGRFNFAAVSLIFAFVVNFNPLYVIPGYMIYRLYLLRFSNPKFKAVKLDHQLGSFKAQKWNEGSCVDDQYDHILLGNDFSTYLTAALLSRIGRRCCILEPVGLPPQILCSGKEEISLNSLTFFRPDRVKVFHVIYF